jgi:hypothetical protein
VDPSAIEIESSALRGFRFRSTGEAERDEELDANAVDGPELR